MAEGGGEEGQDEEGGGGDQAGEQRGEVEKVQAEGACVATHKRTQKAHTVLQRARRPKGGDGQGVVEDLDLSAEVAEELAGQGSCEHG